MDPYPPNITLPFWHWQHVIFRVFFVHPSSISMQCIHLGSGHIRTVCNCTYHMQYNKVYVQYFKIIQQIILGDLHVRLQFTTLFQIAIKSDYGAKNLFSNPISSLLVKSFFHDYVVLREHHKRECCLCTIFPYKRPQNHITGGLYQYIHVVLPDLCENRQVDRQRIEYQLCANMEYYVSVQETTESYCR